MFLRFCDLDLDSVTFIYELDMTILKMYLRTNINFLRQGFQQMGTTNTITLLLGY